MIVGLTGGIGSGKTTVAGIFARLGVPVYEADQASKNIIDADKVLQGKLQNLLGADIVNSQGKIVRDRMASIIFNDEELLKKTNALIHPAVAEDFRSWVAAQDYPYVLKEAAILFESGSYKQCDKIVVVEAPEELRIERVMKRGNVSREQVLERMRNQMPQEQKVALADYVIHNDLQQSVITQVLSVHENLIRQANQRSR